MRLAGARAGRLDHVGVDRALREPARVVLLAGFLFENFDEQVADRLALVFRIIEATEFLHETILGIDANHVHAHVLGEGFHDLVALAVAQQAGVDEDAGQLVADRPVQQGRHHRRVDTARQTENDLVLADPRAHLGDRRVDDIGRGPLRAATADLVQEAREDRRALQRVRDLGMKLQAVDMALLVGHAGDRRAVGARHQLEPGRHFGDAVAVRHPHVEHAVTFGGLVVLDIAQQLGMAARAHAGVTEFALADVFDLAAELLGDRLHAVADAENRQAELEQPGRNFRTIAIQGRFRAAREYESTRAEITDLRELRIPGVNFAVNPGFAHAARDQLRVLRAEIEDQDPVVVQVAHQTR